jgi:hypothetical protein
MHRTHQALSLTEFVNRQPVIRGRNLICGNRFSWYRRGNNSSILERLPSTSIVVSSNCILTYDFLLANETRCDQIGKQPLLEPGWTALPLMR